MISLAISYLMMYPWTAEITHKCKGVNIYLGATGHSLCPIRGILPYLTLRGSRRGPLFLLEDGRGLTRQLFSTSLDNLLSELKRDTRNYSTHSFRIGAATSAKTANIPDTFIKMMGHWRSDVYQRYNQNPTW